MPDNSQAPDMKQVFAEIEQQVKTLAESTVSNFKDQAVADAKVMVENIKADLTRWTNLLSTNQIKIAEFEFLVLTEKALVKMTALEQAGLAQARIAGFLTGVLNVAIDVVLKKVVGNAPPAPLVA